MRLREAKGPQAGKHGMVGGTLSLLSAAQWAGPQTPAVGSLWAAWGTNRRRRSPLSSPTHPLSSVYILPSRK